MLGATRPKTTGREHSNFQSRTASDVAGELTKRWSNLGEEETGSTDISQQGFDGTANPYEPATNASTPPPRSYSFTKWLFHWGSNRSDQESHANEPPESGRGMQRNSSHNGSMTPDPATIQAHNRAENKRANGDPSAPRPGLGPRPIGGSDKLGMFSGVYVPTCLNVLSILMFLRFGFLLGLCFHDIGATGMLLVSVYVLLSAEIL
jgi:potassium/chloride transporter 9